MTFKIALIAFLAGLMLSGCLMPEELTTSFKQNKAGSGGVLIADTFILGIDNSSTSKSVEINVLIKPSELMAEMPITLELRECRAESGDKQDGFSVQSEQFVMEPNQKRVIKILFNSENYVLTGKYACDLIAASSSDSLTTELKFTII